MRRRFSNKKKELVLNLKEFHPSGNYRFFVPEGCYEMDVFLVGGGAGGGTGMQPQLEEDLDIQKLIKSQMNLLDLGMVG